MNTNWSLTRAACVIISLHMLVPNNELGDEGRNDLHEDDLSVKPFTVSFFWANHWSIKHMIDRVIASTSVKETRFDKENCYTLLKESLVNGFCHLGHPETFNALMTPNSNGTHNWFIIFYTKNPKRNICYGIN